MKLDRNAPDGKNKFAVINMRKIPGNPQTPAELAAAILANPECVEFGRVGEPDEFFVVKLKDQYADHALHAYGTAARKDDPEYGVDVLTLARRAGTNSPFCKHPD